MNATESRTWPVVAAVLVAAFAIAVGWVVERRSVPPPPPRAVGTAP